MDVVYWFTWAGFLDSLHRGYWVFLIPLYGLGIALVYRSWRPTLPWWMGIGWMLMTSLIPLLDQTNQGYVELSTPTYSLVRWNHQRYYVSQLHDSYLEMGDQFVCQTEPILGELSMTTMEGSFDFSAYLHLRNIHQRLSCPLIITKKTWFPLHAWKTSLLSSWSDQDRPLIGHLFFQEDYAKTSLSIVSFFSISGLGWWTVIWFIDRGLKPLIGVHPHRIMLTLFILPYSILMVTSFSIVRVSWFYLVSLWRPPSHQRWLRRWGVLVYFVLIPYSYLQQGFHLYVLFKLYYQAIHPWLTKQAIAIKVSTYVSFLYAIQWLFFQHINLIQPLLYPLWLIGFPPLWLWIAFAWKIPWFHLGISTVLSWLTPRLQFISTQAPMVYPRSIPWVGILFLFVSLFILLYAIRYALPRLRQMSFLITVSMLLFSQLPLERWIHPFRVHFINVGQGDATLLEIKNYRILIDTGGSLYQDVAQEVLIPYLSTHAIYRLHHVIITHDDFDHGGALDSLKQHIQIDTVSLFSFSRLSGPSWHLTNLNHWQEEATEDNEASLILWFQYDSCSLLIMGDAPVRYEKKLIGLSALTSIDVLRVGHHGSLTSTSDAFLAWIRPTNAVISVGGGNRYGHPHPLVLSRLQSRDIPIYRTDLHGTIVMNSCKIKS